MKFVTVAIFLSALIVGLFFTSCKTRNAKHREEVETQVMRQHDSDVMHNNLSGRNELMNMEMDNRIPLHLPARKAQHQLMNMRNHLKAVQSIIEFLSYNEWNKASEIAHAKLGLTEKMQTMCSSFSNEKFVQLGFAFHRSADTLSVVLKTGDKVKSLQALSKTLQHCVQCHETFRQ